MPLPSAAALADEMALAVRGDPPSGSPAVGGLVAQLVRNNLRQWDLEDETRDPHASDSAVAIAKRAIDQLNLTRHRLVQDIDLAIATSLQYPPTTTRASAPLATESPGMVLDRLSVLVIRRARTATMCADRLPALDAQLAVLVEALDSYLEDLYAGRRRFVAYEHLKLYAAGPNTTGTQPD
jgi:hypothetical protein